MLDMDLGAAYHMLRSQAFYASMPPRVDKYGKSHPDPIDLEGRTINSFTQESDGPPVIRLTSDGLIEGLHSGKAIVQVRFGSSVDNVKVIVR